MFGKLKNIHFIGIGGIGMSGIAELLKYWGFHITGSDTRYSDNIARLEKCGIRIYIGHHPKNLKTADAVIYTSAVNNDNPELKKARAMGIPTIKRSVMLGEILRTRPNSIAICGTHGKTTTTSLTGHIFTCAGRDPLIISGGVIRELNSNLRIGKGDTIILEADEYDHSFLKLYPTHILMTSIDKDHMELFETLTNIKEDFIKFANRIPFYGKVIANRDDQNIPDILSEIDAPVSTYSVKIADTIHAENIHQNPTENRFDVFLENTRLGTIRLPIPGVHNIQNSLAAISISLEYGIEFGAIKEAIENFTGVRRRFEIVAENDDIMLVDDYAHHPTEIKATLQAARKGWHRRIVAVFQPHLYSRTKKFYREFADALEIADIIVITDVYPAREEPLPGVSGQLIEGILRTKGRTNVHYVRNFKEVIPVVKSLYQPGDMIITLGAGDINSILSPLKKDLTDSE